MSRHESLKVQGFKKRIGSLALEFDFEVEPGTRLAVMGPSGSGKTTLLRMLAGLDVPDSGQAWLGDREITKLPVQDRGVGFVFQESALFESMNVLENAAFGLRIRGMPAEKRRAAVMPWLEKVGMARMADREVHRLSGGERQRVAFVRALAWKPRLLLLDEPFSALDPEMRERLRRELLDLHREWPVPLIFVTHDAADAEVLATARLSLTALRVIE